MLFGLNKNPNRLQADTQSAVCCYKQLWTNYRMSNQDKPSTEESAEQSPQGVKPQETKPQVEKPQVAAPQVLEQKPPRRRGFFSSLFSHLFVALIAVIAVTSYMHWVDILKYTGSRVCGPNMLGKYSSQPAMVPPSSLQTPAPGQKKEQTTDKTSQQKTPAAGRHFGVNQRQFFARTKVKTGS